MAPVIWGLDLAEFKWSKFKSGYMWNTEYHLRRTKFIVYQCALIFCVVSESLGTSALSDYVDEEKKIKKVDPTVYTYNNDYIGAASYNIFAGVFIAFIFGAAFFFDLIWPERHENKQVRIAWKVCGVLSVIFHLGAAITLTVITFTRSSYIEGVGPRRQAYLVSQYKKASEAPLIYGHNTRAIAAVAFVWPGWLSVLGSCILLFLSIDNTEFGKGPKSKHARERDGIIGADPESACADPEEKERFAPEASPYAQQIPSQTVSAAAAVAANDNAAAPLATDGAAHAPTSLAEEGRPAAV